jgi:hypothetical protein
MKTHRRRIDGDRHSLAVFQPDCRDCRCRGRTFSAFCRLSSKRNRSLKGVIVVTKKIAEKLHAWRSNLLRHIKPVSF